MKIFINNKFKYLIALVILVLINNCADKNNSNTVIKFWGMGVEGETVSKLIPQFEKENPSIHIKVQMIPWTAAQEKLISAYASDNLPDVFQLGNTWIPQFVAIDALQSLNGFIRKSKIISGNNYFKGIWQTNKIGNNVYAIPWYIDTRVLFYRKDILQKAGYDHPPKTWSELFDVSKKIKELEKGQDKYAIFLPTNDWSIFVIFGLQAGANLLKDNNSYGNFSSKQFKKGFAYLMKFYQDSLAPIRMTNVNNVYQAMSNGYFAMFISGPWNIKEMKKWMRGALKNSWMTAPLPAHDSAGIGVSLPGGSSLVMNSKTKHSKAAWKFIEFLSMVKTQIEFYKLADDLPALKSAWKDSSIIKNKYVKAFYFQLKHIKPLPKITEWEQIAFSKIQQYAEYAANGKLSIDDALHKLDLDVNKILKKRRWLLKNSKNYKLR